MFGESILIVGAHFDDAELGVGGVAAKLAGQGKKVYKLTLTDNVTKSRHLDLDIPYFSSLEGSEAAAKELGIKEIPFDPQPCNGLIYSTSLMQRLESVVFENNIETIFFHFHADLNQDHIAASELCKTAGRHCRNILMYQSNLYVLPESFYPTIYVDISAQLHKKIAALRCYQPEHNRFASLFECTIKRNEVWGYQARCAAAEAFHPVKITI